jgi:long-chain acyl-CoA synthetase
VPDRMPDPSSISRPWIGAYPPGVPPTYRYPDVALSRFLDDAARDFPTVAATWFRGETLDYAELRRAVDALAGALAAEGVAAGDRIAVALPNLPAAVIAAFATWRLGAVLVPLDPELSDDELHRLLEQSRAQVLVCLSPHVPQVNRVRTGLPHLGHVVATGVEEWLRPRSRVLAPLTGRRQGWYRRLRPDDDVLSLADLVDAAPPNVRQADVRGADPAAILYTGGTTGDRKGVVLSHANLVANAFQARLWVPDVHAGRERLLAVLPFWHAYGLTMGLLTGVLAAGTLVLLPRFDVDEVLDTIDAQRPTLFPGVPSMYLAIADHPEAGDHDLTAVRACVSGAAALRPDVAERFERMTGGARLREGYGLTEASPLTHANPIYGRQVGGAVGLPVTDTVAVVVDPEEPTRVLEPGEHGELAVHGPQVMLGYWEDPEATDRVLRDGWLLTGDIAVQDVDGVFRIVDRVEDVVVVDGARVYPREVEEVLRGHPAVAEASALGFPDDQRGGRVSAFVTLAPRARVTPAELREHCREHLPEHAVPDEVAIRADLPSSRLGKVLRRDLRAEVLGAPPEEERP